MGSSYMKQRTSMVLTPVIVKDDKVMRAGWVL